MTSRVYAFLDRNRLGQGLLLDESDLQITTDSTCDINRMVLGDLPAASGDFVYECYLWSTSRGDLSGLASIGVANPDAALDNYVGGDTTSVGFRMFDGEIHAGGASISTVDVQAERRSLQVWLHLRPTAASVGFYVDGNEVYVATLDPGLVWLPAFSIGSSSPSDLNLAVNFGQWRFDRSPRTIGGPTYTSLLSGWSKQTAGLATFYLALATEAFMSSAASDPANTPFGPYILSPNQITISRQPRAWFHNGGGGSNPAAIAAIKLDNSTGAFNALLGADVRDSPIVLQQIDAPARGAGDTSGAVTIFTGILDSVRADASTVTLTIRSVLTRFDKPLPCRIVPPFYDPSSAGKIRPIGLGSQRNVQPMFLEEQTDGEILYLLGDSAMSNVTQVSDMAAPLDPNSLPPQWTTALDGEGVLLASAAVGRVAADCSSVGDQYTIPGADDVLNGDGSFSGWTETSGDQTHTPPPDFDFSDNTGNILRHWHNPAYAPTSDTAALTSVVPWYPQGSKYGDYLVTNTEPLLAGRSYRVTFRLVYTIAAQPQRQGGLTGGFMLRTALSNDPADAVTAHGIAIQKPTGGVANYAFEFTVPLGSARDLYLIVTASDGATVGTGYGSGGAEFYDIKVELLGQFVSIPLAGILPTDAMTEILINRAGEEGGIFNTGDTDALAIYEIGLRYESPPNILNNCLQDIADAYGAILFDDADGAIRMRQWDSPENGSVVAAFDRRCVSPSTIAIYDDTAPGLTNLFGCKRNWTPFTDSDFVSDTATVPPAERAAYKAAAQVFFTASKRPAQQYLAAIGAARRILPIDDEDAARREGNRVCGMFSVKRRWIEFDALFEGLTLGIDTTVQAHQLYPGDIITLDIPELGLNAQRMRVGGTTLYPLAGKIKITGWF